MVLSTMSTTYLWILFSPNSTHVKKNKKQEDQAFVKYWLASTFLTVNLFRFKQLDPS